MVPTIQEENENGPDVQIGGSKDVPRDGSNLPNDNLGLMRDVVPRDEIPAAEPELEIGGEQEIEHVDLSEMVSGRGIGTSDSGGAGSASEEGNVRVLADAEIPGAEIIMEGIPVDCIINTRKGSDWE